MIQPPTQFLPKLNTRKMFWISSMSHPVLLILPFSKSHAELIFFNITTRGLYCFLIDSCKRSGRLDEVSLPLDSPRLILMLNNSTMNRATRTSLTLFLPSSYMISSCKRIVLMCLMALRTLYTHIFFQVAIYRKNSYNPTSKISFSQVSYIVQRCMKLMSIKRMKPFLLSTIPFSVVNIAYTTEIASVSPGRAV